MRFFALGVGLLVSFSAAAQDVNPNPTPVPGVQYPSGYSGPANDAGGELPISTLQFQHGSGSMYNADSTRSAPRNAVLAPGFFPIVPTRPAE